MSPSLKLFGSRQTTQFSEFVSEFEPPDPLSARIRERGFENCGILFKSFFPFLAELTLNSSYWQHFEPHTKNIKSLKSLKLLIFFMKPYGVVTALRRGVKDFVMSFMDDSYLKTTWNMLSKNREVAVWKLVLKTLHYHGWAEISGEGWTERHTHPGERRAVGESFR